MFGIALALTVLLLVGMVLVAESLYRFRRDGWQSSQLVSLLGGVVLVLIAVAFAVPAPSADRIGGKAAAQSPTVQPGFSPKYDTPARKRYKKKEGLDMGRYQA